MADITRFDSGYARPRKARGVEYWVYFALIFVFAIPFATGGVILTALGLGGTRRSGGIIRRAWAEATEIATKICSI